MKQILLAGLAVLALAPAALGGPDPIWQNDGIYVVGSNQPPIDALSFFNNVGGSFNFFGLDLFTTSDTLNFTNLGIISADPGFDFETFPSSVGQVHMAGNFVNRAVNGNGGIISTSGALFGSTNFIIAGGSFAFLSGNSECIVAATNIQNSGTINMGQSSLMKLTGQNVDLSRGTLLMTNTSGIFIFTFGGFLSAQLFSGGLLDNAWGVGSADPKYLANPSVGQAFLLDPAVFYGNPVFTPGHDITLRAGGLLVRASQLVLANPVAYIELDSDVPVGGSNTWTEAVFLANPNPAFVNTVYFPGATGVSPPVELAVQWQWLTTNWPSQVVTTNYIVLEDNFAEGGTPGNPLGTNIGLRFDGNVNPQSLLPEPTYIPENYTFTIGTPFFGATPATPVASAAGLLGTGVFSNNYAAYQALFTAADSLPTDVAGGSVTNLSGRIEVSGENSLDLSGTHIAALNYLKLQAANHFRGASGAQIASPHSDFDLRTTNAVLAFTNLVAPFLPHASGLCDLWSARYTNIIAGVTNSYHVLFVNSQIEPTTVPDIQTLHLTVTNSMPGAPRNNLFISDVLNVTSDLMLKAQAITLTTNGPGAAVPAGQLNVSNPNIQWSTATPGLLYLTNYGQISNANAVVFGGSRASFTSNPNGTNSPYQAFVNHGNVLNQGSQIYSVYFENGGVFNSGGSIDLHQASAALLTNGAFFAGGDVGIESASLFVSNHVFLGAGGLNLSVSYYLDDGSYATASAFGVTNKNFWTTGNGISLTVLPTYSSLLGTIVTNIAVSYAPVPITWAAKDLGCSPDGFSDNAALGHLILDGLDANSVFVFSGTGAANAIYVDELELVDSVATNTDSSGDFLGVQINPGMKVYYAQAIATTTDTNGVVSSNSVAEKLNGRNGGGFCWVSNYNCGFFSSTTETNPADGKIYLVNSALRFSPDINSSGNGVNESQVFPIPLPLPPCPITPPAVVPLANSIPPDSAIVLRTLETPVSYAGSGSNTITFAQAQGAYSGLFHGAAGVTTASAGYLTVTTTSRGAYSGRLSLGGRTYSLSGQFSASGWATNTIGYGASALTVQLHLDLSGAEGVQGYVSSGANWVADLQADPQVQPRAASLAGYAGNYTMIIPPGDDGPQGVGFGTVRVDGSGNVRWSGTLADGTRVSQSSAVSAQGIWPLYAPLYGGQGSVLSWVQFTNGGLVGELIWMKPAGVGRQAGSLSYGGGFTNEVWATGSLYNPPATGHRLPGWSSGAGSIIFEGGGLDPFTNALTLDVHNRVASPTTNKLSLFFNTFSGSFNGTAWNPLANKRISISGVLSEEGSNTIGAGFFLNGSLSGEVYVSPSP